MWVLIEKFEGDRLQGSLQNDPVDLKHMKALDHVSLKVEDVKDWMIIKDGEQIGYFTLEVMQRNAEK